MKNLSVVRSESEERARVACRARPARTCSASPQCSRSEKVLDGEGARHLQTSTAGRSGNCLQDRMNPVHS
jgi:hypothetical protein